ncbi:hypothetical protein AVEN_228447-1 [Araneus ventricosus]|uniref:Uncharacterized protein n=1 Tax=Araneus ventricosus TaxID=182803 RepID=A0A4Y2QVY9_ARAVE|nr:hypothetical protein AVEN_187226-1 [Araneus ventricosus]GBN68717.1 hypothetical protein AVEN_54694-1 [Araneus ventricosus]GBN70375.1 hypothetical protein AVEN_57730-1 [Araneus ventricosus]GBN70412.1 hypothetical protein AVEN_228447-1 [Araneus ventricosus]
MYNCNSGLRLLIITNSEFTSRTPTKTCILCAETQYHLWRLPPRSRDAVSSTLHCTSFRLRAGTVTWRLVAWQKYCSSSTLKSQNIMTTYSITRCASFGLQNNCNSPGIDAKSFWYMTGDRLYQMSKQRSRKVEIFGHGGV